VRGQDLKAPTGSQPLAVQYRSQDVATANNTDDKTLAVYKIPNNYLKLAKNQRLMYTMCYTATHDAEYDLKNGQVRS